MIFRKAFCLASVFLLVPMLLSAMTIGAIPAHAQAPAPEELLQDNPPPAAIEQLTPDPRTLPPTGQENKLKLPYQKYSDIPDEALVEMQKFHKSCEESPIYSRHYDCDCRSTRYLEERLNKGPNVSRVQIMTTINGECFNIPGAAGYALEQCEKFGVGTYDGGMSPEDYCQCVANNYALELQAKRGQRLTKASIGNMQTSAIVRCASTKPGQRPFLKRLDKAPESVTGQSTNAPPEIND